MAVHRPRPDRGALAALMVAVATLLVATGCGHVGRPTAGPRPSHGGTAAARGPATSPGPDGTRAGWVIAENERPGSTGWQISGTQPAGAIAGYADHVQAQVGDTVTLYVSTLAPDLRVYAYRMGYYRGDGARLVWTSPEVAGRVQPRCPLTPGIYLVECHWSASLRVRLTPAFVQGDYLFKLVGSGGQQSYVPLTVWDPASDATYVVMNSVLTWQAFNGYGGYDYYLGQPPGLTGYPYPTRSRVVSFDRPYLDENGAGSFLGLDYPLVRFAEQHGLDVTYWTDITLSEHGAALLRHRALLSLGHDEEWDLAMRTAAVAARAAGVNLAFFGASPILRKVRLQASPLGADREVVNYRDVAADPLYGKQNSQVTQNDWSQPPADAPASELVGATYIGYNNAAVTPLVVADAGSWLFRGTGLRQGAQVPGVFTSDFQAVVPGQLAPPGVTVLATSPVLVTTSDTRAVADTTYYVWSASGAQVFSSGTNNWIPALLPCAPSSACPAAQLARMTGNLLARLAGPVARG